MRHRKSGRKLNRDASHRRAMFRNMSISLFEHELIKTTLPKAKELRRVVEPLITLAKSDSVANRRLAFSRLGNKAAVAKLFEELGPRYEQRPGGYVRILKCGFRQGDRAPMAFIELVDRPEFADGGMMEDMIDEPVVIDATPEEAPKKETAKSKKAEPAKTAAKAEKSEAKPKAEKKPAAKKAAPKKDDK